MSSQDSFTKEQIQSNHGANGPLKQATAVNSGNKGGPSTASSSSNVMYRVTGAGGPSRTGRVASSAGVLPPPSYEVPASDPRAKAIAARAAAAQQQPPQAPSPAKATAKPPQPAAQQNSGGWASELPPQSLPLSQPQQPPGFEKLSEIWGTNNSSAASAPAGGTGGGGSNNSSASFGHSHGGFGDHSAFASALFPSSTAGLGSGSLNGVYGGSSLAFASSSGLLSPAGKVGGYASSRDNVFSLLATALPPHPGGGNYSGGGDSLSSSAFGGNGGAAALNGGSSLWGSGGNSGGGSIWGSEQPDPWGNASSDAGSGTGGNTAGRAPSQGPPPSVPPPLHVAAKPKEGGSHSGGGGTGMSGMAMLQQMLPGVNLTYGSGASGGGAEQPRQQQQQQPAGDIWGSNGNNNSGGGGSSIW